MFSLGFHPAPFLRAVASTEPFRDYCALRSLRFDPTADGETAMKRWAGAVAALAASEQAKVELELAQVHELSTREGNTHLLEAAGGGALPSEDITSGAAVALWFFVNRHDLFQDVFFQHEVSEVHNWRAAKAIAGMDVGVLAARAEALGESVREFFHHGTGAGRFCAVEARILPDAICFATRVADRIQLVESFADDGTTMLHRLRPALAVLFVYAVTDGSVRLKSPVRANDRVHDLFQRFGSAVLGHSVTGFGEGFDLDKLKRPLLLLPDAEDMGTPRLKALHLRYPSRLGRQTVKLETRLSDEPGAMSELLRTHVTNAQELAVCHAEIAVPIRTGERARSHLVRLWPDRCNLNQTPLGQRLRRCLDRWGLRYA